MASKSRSKSGKAARKQLARPRRDQGVPLLPIVVGAILGVLAIAMIGFIVYLNRPGPAPQKVSGIPCDQLEHTQVHYHAALQIVYQGNVVNIPDNTGIQSDSAGNPNSDTSFAESASSHVSNWNGRLGNPVDV